MSRAKSNIPSVVVIGGGTGTYTVLSGLRGLPVQITALLTMVDDGGSNKMLRDEFGLLPTSGVRLAMVALAKEQSLLRELFLYRFHQGTGISGMTFGNLFLAAVSDITGSQKAAIERTCQLLSVEGKVLPISWDDVQLVAKYAGGHEVIGEHRIDEPHHTGGLRITKLTTIPKAKISKEAKDAIMDADLIVLGPGDFYTNTVADLIISGVPEALKKTKAKIVFVMNLMTKYSEAFDYKASDFLTDLDKYLPLSNLDYVLINNDKNFPKDAIARYKKEKDVPVVDDLSSLTLPSNISIIRKPLLSQEEIKPQKGDDMKRSMIRHDTKKLAKALLSLL